MQGPIRRLQDAAGPLGRFVYHVILVDQPGDGCIGLLPHQRMASSLRPMSEWSRRRAAAARKRRRTQTDQKRAAARASERRQREDPEVLRRSTEAITPRRRRQDPEVRQREADAKKLRQYDIVREASAHLSKCLQLTHYLLRSLQARERYFLNTTCQCREKFSSLTDCLSSLISIPQKQITLWMTT